MERGEGQVDGQGDKVMERDRCIGKGDRERGRDGDRERGMEGDERGRESEGEEREGERGGHVSHVLYPRFPALLSLA